MVTLGALWMPILVAAIVVYVAASIVWMLLPHHKKDWRKLPGEKSILEAMHTAGVERGQYHFPHATPSEMKDPEVVEKLERGPVGLMVVMPRGVPKMGKSLIFYFLYCLVISIFVAYVAAHCLPRGVPYLSVFRVVGTVAILAYAGAIPVGAIWFGRSWSTTWKEVLDGVVYGLLTAGVFGWLWP